MEFEYSDPNNPHVKKLFQNIKILGQNFESK